MPTYWFPDPVPMRKPANLPIRKYRPGDTIQAVEVNKVLKQSVDIKVRAPRDQDQPNWTS